MLNSLRSRWNLSLPASRAAVSAPALRGPSSTLSTQTPPPRHSGGLQAAVDCAATLPAARVAFEMALEGVTGEGFVRVRGAIRRACSMHDLWHVRTDLYNEIARQLAQSVAEQRLAGLSGYFMPLEDQGAPR